MREGNWIRIEDDTGKFIQFVCCDGDWIEDFGSPETQKILTEKQVISEISNFFEEFCKEVRA